MMEMDVAPGDIRSVMRLAKFAIRDLPIVIMRMIEGFEFIAAFRDENGVGRHARNVADDLFGHYLAALALRLRAFTDERRVYIARVSVGNILRAKHPRRDHPEDAAVRHV